MKPFNLEQALAGKPVITRKGVKVVRLFHAEEANEANKVIVVLETGLVGGYAEDGTYYTHSVSELDLVMAPQKKEGWVNLYLSYDNYVVCSYCVHPTQEAAEEKAEVGVIATIKIEWEE